MGRRIQGALTCAVFLIAMACSGGGGNPPPPPPPAPSITSFSANPPAITAGQSSTMSWTTTNAATVSISGVSGAQSLNGSASVQPATTTTYTLTAADSAGRATTSATTITVNPPPTITSFTANPSAIFPGQTAQLTAVFSNGTGGIDNGVGTVTSGVPKTVTPSSTTSYTLTVSNSLGAQATTTALVTVVPAPTISSFAATPTIITAGQSATLYPVFINVISASIDHGVGPVISGTGYTVTPAATTTYTLMANGMEGPVIGQVTVSVNNGSTLFLQQGPKLVGSGAIAGANQGMSVSLSTDGNTAIVGGQIESWIWTKGAGGWSRPIKIPETGYSVSLSADGKTALLSTSAGAVLWSMSTGVWVRGQTLEAPDAHRMIASQYSVSLSSDGNTALVGGFANEGAWVWINNGGTWAQQGPKLVAADAVGHAWQGNSVSLSADGNTAVIGGPLDDHETGAVWVWTRTGNVWAQQGPKLVGSGATGAAAQGQSVFLSADGNTIAVGGWGDNSNVGAAWIWTRSGATWTQQGAKLVGSAPIGSSQQGVSVSLSADGNTAIVGGDYDNTLGAAWVWTRSAGLWTQQGAKLIGSQSTSRAFQANSVSLAANGNTAIIGGPGDHDLGAAWVWTRNTGSWTEQTKLVDSGATGIADQGYWDAVSLSADGNTAIVGGPLDNKQAGAAWIWTRNGSVWTQGPKLVGSGAVGNALQGRSVRLSADGNTAIVGGSNDNNGVGAAWVWTRNGTVWTQQGSKLVGAGAVGSAGQGNGVALSADGNTAIVGGGGDDSQIGAAWVWTRSGGIWAQQGPKLTGSGAVFGTNGSYQGIHVALSADGNTALVAGSGDNDGKGAVWVWVRSGSTWTQQGPKLVGLDSVHSQGYSVSLSADGNTAIVGSPVDARIWARSSGIWTQQGPLIPTGAEYWAGISVSLSAAGDLAVVAGEDGNTRAGALWFWTRSGSVWTQQGTKLIVEGNKGFSRLDSVSLSGDGRTVIAASGWDNNFAGAAWVFTR